MISVVARDGTVITGTTIFFFNQKGDYNMEHIDQIRSGETVKHWQRRLAVRDAVRLYRTRRSQAGGVPEEITRDASGKIIRFLPPKAPKPVNREKLLADAQRAARKVLRQQVANLRKELKAAARILMQQQRAARKILKDADKARSAQLRADIKASNEMIRSEFYAEGN